MVTDKMITVAATHDSDVKFMAVVTEEHDGELVYFESTEHRVGKVVQKGIVILWDKELPAQFMSSECLGERIPRLLAYSLPRCGLQIA